MPVSSVNCGSSQSKRPEFCVDVVDATVMERDSLFAETAMASAHNANAADRRTMEARKILIPPLILDSIMQAFE